MSAIYLQHIELKYQYICSMSTVCLQHTENNISIYLQYVYNMSTTCVQHIFNMPRTDCSMLAVGLQHYVEHMLQTY